MGAYTPEFIKESTAGSHVAVWGEPQFTKFGMLIFTAIFGFFGLHHVLLRSPLTGLLCMIVNFMTLGYWYFFDLAQLWETSADDLNKYGLGSPFLWQFGVAVGMWKGGELKVRENGTLISTLNQAGGGSNVPVPAPVAAAVAAPVAAPAAAPSAVGPNSIHPPDEKEKEKEKVPVTGELATTAGGLMELTLKIIIGWLLSRRPDQAPKEYEDRKDPPSPWITLMFILAMPFGPVASIIAGDYWNALFHCNPLFYIYAIIETVYILLFPMEVFINGLSRPFPYTQIFSSIDIDGQSPNIQRSKQIPQKPEDAQKAVQPFIDFAKYLMALVEGILPYIPFSLGRGANKAAEGVADIGKAAILSAKARPVQKGGGAGSDAPDTIAIGIVGAVLLGGLFLGLGRSNVFQGNDDSPPNAGAV